jgi:hypothetical protein
VPDAARAEVMLNPAAGVPPPHAAQLSDSKPSGPNRKLETGAAWTVIVSVFEVVEPMVAVTVAVPVVESGVNTPVDELIVPSPVASKIGEPEQFVAVAATLAVFGICTAAGAVMLSVQAELEAIPVTVAVAEVLPSLAVTI